MGREKGSGLISNFEETDCLAIDKQQLKSERVRKARVNFCEMLLGKLVEGSVAGQKEPERRQKLEIPACGPRPDLQGARPARFSSRPVTNRSRALHIASRAHAIRSRPMTNRSRAQANRSRAAVPQT